MDDVRALSRRARRLLTRYRRVLGALLLGCAVLIVLESASPDPPVRRPVVVAARDLPPGQPLTSDDLTVALMPPDLIPSGARASVSALVGRTVAGPVRAREVITDLRLVGRSLLRHFPAGTVAAPVRIRDGPVVAMLRVGDRVDVFAARSDRAAAADLVVADVPVVAMPDGAEAGQDGLALVAVSVAQAAALAQAAATAPLSLARGG
jgi:Flp pilus assembly protein CpaB